MKDWPLTFEGDLAKMICGVFNRYEQVGGFLTWEKAEAALKMAYRLLLDAGGER